MKVVGSIASRKAFLALWRMSGKPVLEAIAPITQWTIPYGITYSAQRDQFVNSAGALIKVPWSIQLAVTIPFLPKPQHNDVAFNVPGINTTSSTSLTLLWSVETARTIETAWGIHISGKLYRVKSFQVIPLGSPTPNSIDVELIESTSQ